MFALLGVTLLQPEQVIADRVPGGAGALGQWLQGIQTALARYYSERTEGGCRSLTLGIGPDGPINFWLAAEKEALPLDEQAEVRALAAEVPAPLVNDGPVVLALVYSIGNDAPPEAQLTLPDAWRAVSQGSEQPLSVEEIVLRLHATSN
jgi:hypothetical protein